MEEGGQWREEGGGGGYSGGRRGTLVGGGGHWREEGETLERLLLRPSHGLSPSVGQANVAVGLRLQIGY